MKTTNTPTKLAFAKNSLVELNNNQLHDINGGSTPLCSGSAIFYTIVYTGTMNTVLAQE
ncbi:class I lanthipeptide [Flavobacterium sp. WV_118_3]|jgi:hypothetical protein|uniref:class I lanthipeptide n=1 Tax=Flavobacterium sp. WV_118_3 TaxID=3151764 RepID=UPI002C8AEE5C|nr:class I lanthipeptide [Flavobacterium sp.]